MALALAKTTGVKAQTPTFTVSPTSLEIPEAGRSFNITITVTDSPAVVQWALNITWDPAVLNITNPNTDVREGNFFQGHTTMFLVKPPQPGLISEMTCVLLDPTTVSGSGTLCEITFTAIDVGQTSIDIVWGVLVYEDGTELHPTLVDGSVTVIPEFQPFMLLALFLAATATITIMTRNAHRRKYQGCNTVNK
jgi:hypothetical protein